MTIDTDILSFGEFNANATDQNNKINQFSNIALTAQTAADTNKLAIRRSSNFTPQGQEAYNGHIQNFGNISGNVALSLNGNTCRTAMTATVVDNTFVTDFTGIVTGVVYVLLIKQDSIGGRTVRWPYGASIIKSVATDPDQLTEVYIAKTTAGKLFIRCEAFRNTSDVGEVIKEFAFPYITFPDGAQAPMSFTWSKAPALSYGGTLTDLYSDWEIAEDALYTNLLFSSYGNTVDVSSIQVVLTQAGSAYMRTRYGGIIGGEAKISPWDEAVVEFSGIDGDRYWDQTVLCINANKYGWEGSRKIVDEKGFSPLTLIGDTKIVDDSGKWAINFDGSDDYIAPIAGLYDLGTSSFTMEMWFSTSSFSVGTNQFLWAINPLGTAYNSISVFLQNSTRKISFNFTNVNTGNVLSFLSTDLLEAGVTYHVSLVRNESIFKFYLNGSQIYSGTSALSTKTGCSLVIAGGADNNGTGNNPLNGKIYSYRITKNIARYTTDFTVDLNNPYFKTGNLWWTPEPKFISNEKFSDYQNWDKVVSCLNFYGPSGSTSFSDTSGGSVTVFGNSVLGVTSNLSHLVLDGNGDYLKLGADINFSDRDFCLEWFLSRTNTTASGNIFCTRGSSTENGILIGFNNTSPYGMYINLGNGSTWFFNQTYSLTANSDLFHLAIVRFNETIYIYVNGTLFSSNAVSGTVSSVVGSTTLGADLGNSGMGFYPFNGKIYSFRASHFARYTSDFTVDLTRPYFITKPKVENWADTSLLINAYNLPSGSTDIRDEKGNAVSVFGDAKVAVDTNGNSYVNFDGSGDYLNLPSFASFNLGSVDLTIELFVSLNSSSVAGGRLFGFGGWQRGFGFECSYYPANTKIIFQIGGSSTWNYSFDPIYSSVVSDQLINFVVQRTSNVWTFYVNGILVYTSVTTTANFTTTNDFRIFEGGGLSPIGKLYGLRLTKGKALYTSNFAVDLTNPYFPAVYSISDLWLDANDYSKLTLATGVSQINDKSYNNRHATQGTTASQPALVQNAQNGLMALGFDGSDRLTATGKALGTSGDIFCLVVGKFNISATQIAIMFGAAGVNLGIGMGYNTTDSTPKYNSWVWGTADVKIVGSVNETFIEEFHKVGNTLNLALNGIESGSTAISLNLTGANINIGATASSVFFANGVECEILVAYSVFTKHFINRLRGYIAHKWGLTDNLPANHPFKTGFPVEDFRTDDYWYATVLCINATDIIKPTEIVDSKRMNKITVYGNITTLIDSSNKPYINFDGSGDYTNTSANSSVNLGTENFTIECFINTTQSAGTYIAPISSNSPGWVAGYFGIRTRQDSANVVAFSFFAGSTGYNMVTSVNVSDGNNHHIAAVRSGTTFHIFVDGTLALTQSGISGAVNGSGYGVNLAYNSADNTYFNGKIYSARITKGIARYTEDFVVDINNPYFPKKSLPVWWTPAEIATALWLDDSGEHGTDFNGSAIYTTANIVLPEFCAVFIALDAANTTTVQIAIEHSTNFQFNVGSFYLSIGEAAGQIHYGFVGSNGFYVLKYPVPTGKMTLSLLHNAARNLSVYNNGAIISGSDVATNGTSFPASTLSRPIYVGARSGNQYPMTGPVREVVILGAVPTTDIRQRIEGYLAHKWDRILDETARVTSLPVGHPYKSAPPTI